MSNVTLAIGGRHYTVACAEGEEQHVTRLGSMIDEKLAAMGNGVGQSEVRQLLFASLVLADELHEARNSAPATHVPTEPDLDFAPALEGIADQIENLAEQLENGPGTP